MSSSQQEIDSLFMAQALAQAQIAARKGDVPVGAIIVNAQNELLSQGYNRKEAMFDPTQHAELWAIQLATRNQGNWHLDGCTLYSTLEPCAMCFGAALQSRVKRIVYAAPEPKFGAIESQVRLNEVPFNHSIEIEKGIAADQSASLLRAFFRTRREASKSKVQ